MQAAGESSVQVRLLFVACQRLLIRDFLLVAVQELLAMRRDTRGALIELRIVSLGKTTRKLTLCSHVNSALGLPRICIVCLLILCVLRDDFQVRPIFVEGLTALLHDSDILAVVPLSFFLLAHLVCVWKCQGVFINYRLVAGLIQAAQPHRGWLDHAYIAQVVAL